MAIFSMGSFACSREAHGAEKIPAPKSDVTYQDKTKPQTAVFAGGCFWCTEAVFEQLDGVLDVTSGYTGGTKETANYDRVCQGDTGHAEAIRITYDPNKVTYAKLLQVFFTGHDPTTKNAQGPDHGTQYRSAIFFSSEDEKKVAADYIKQLDDAKVFSRPIVTTLEALKEFYPAETYHQDFARQNPSYPYILQQAAPKVEKIREKFPEQLKGATTQPAK